MDKVRELSLKLLYKIDVEKAYSNILLSEVLKKNKSLNEKDIGLLFQLTYGVTTWRLTLDAIIKKYSKIKMKKISPWIINILRMGIYQIVFLDKIPKSAAVNESVNLAKRYGHQSSSSFVNAILRKVTKQDYIELDKLSNPIERISKITSTPEWLVKQLVKERENIDEVESICKQLNKTSKITVRRNRLKITKEEFEKELLHNQISFENLKINISEEEKAKKQLDSNEIQSDFYILNKIKNIENMELLKKGYLTIQDFSAGLVAYYLQPKKGEKILDACSAPGGKTTYLAELMQNQGYIEAWDVHEQRIKLVKENAERLGITIIHGKQNDATIYHQEYEEQFDKILLDVPCLGIGVIKRKPDIKWQRTSDDILLITKIQKQILESCKKYIKQGGIIIYSTCSILKEENSNIIKEFVKNNKEFKIEKIDGNNDYIEILPSDTQDGFFITKLKKI